MPSLFYPFFLVAGGSTGPYEVPSIEETFGADIESSARQTVYIGASLPGFEEDMAPPEGFPRSSVQDEGRREALAYRWIESEKAGRDLGEACIKRWVHEHWNGFLRARWIEHLQGRTYWMELD